MSEATLHEGLSGATSLGTCGAYRPGVEQDEIRAGSLLWREGMFWTPCANPRPVLRVAAGRAFSASCHDASWTGKSIRFDHADGSATVHLRNTLPGPLFEIRGRDLPLRWAAGFEPARIERLDGCGGCFGSRGSDQTGGSALFMLRSAEARFLLATDGRMDAVRICSHHHWWLSWPEGGGRCLLARLLCDGDIPLDPARQTIWRDLLAAPPLHCEESFAEDRPQMRLIQRFPGASVSPVPPGWAAMPAGGFFAPPPTLRLLDLPAGPYSIVRGDNWSASADITWMAARWQFSGPVSAPLSGLPDEAAYPGDNTWQPGSPSDQWMSLRLWAPLLPGLPAGIREELRLLLDPPSAGACRVVFESIREPVSGRAWTKDRTVFDDNGDVCYDADWYNGLALSGMARAVECDDPEIAKRAAEVCAELRPERKLLASYFEIFSDWALGATWSDVRGVFVNTNCLLNGMEGLLAESRLRDREGDVSGAIRMRYLALRTALTWQSLGFQLPFAARADWIDGEAGSPTPSATMLFEASGLTPLGPRSKNLYALPSHFPEASALMAAHGQISAWQELARQWETDCPQRYRDWLAFYLADDPTHPTYPCERRLQGAVAFTTSPEAGLRKFVLGECPVSIEARYATPLALCDQVLLRGATLASREPACP